jgi:hypothetical protein
MRDITSKDAWRRESGNVKIAVNKSNPIWVSPRLKNGATIMQGRARIMLSADELTLLVQALKTLNDDVK